ncbi:MAG: CorA family divalent cation transporter [Chthoniobacterales bacterium]
MSNTSTNPPTAPGMDALHRFNRWLGEGIMGFLALIALTLALIPEFFNVSTRVANGLYLGQWVVVGAFMIDYTTHFITAKSKWRFVRSRVRILYALIIIVAFASLLQSVPDVFVAAPALHFFNVIAGILLSARAGAVVVEHFEPDANASAPQASRVFVANPDQKEVFHETTWLELIQWTNEPSNRWYLAESAGENELAQLSKATDIPETILKSCVAQENYPRIFFFGPSVLVSLWLRLSPDDNPDVSSDVPLVLILNKHGLVSLCPENVHLHRRVEDLLAGEIAVKLPFNLRALYSVFDFVLHRKQDRIDRLEQILRRLENFPSTAFRSETLQQVYALKSDVTGLRADLWRLKELFERLEAGKIHFPGTLPAHHAAFDYLAEDADFLYHTAEQLRESIVSLIDLHITRSSYEMNKFMRLLAVISALGFIPAAVSGMLGMNIAGAPWPWSLPQVGFIVASTCVFCLYYFVVKGWLR